MYTKKYYEMKIAECEYQIEGNNKLKNKLIDKLGVIGSRKNNEEEYIYERSFVYKRLQMAQSKGVILMGEEMELNVNYENQNNVITCFNAIILKIRQKIDELDGENQYMLSKIKYYKEEIKYIEGMDYEE